MEYATSNYRKFSHVVHRCDYQLVIVSKRGHRILFGEIADSIEHDIRVLCCWSEVEVHELSVQADHVRLVCSIPPMVSVSAFVRLLKGRLAVKLLKVFAKQSLGNQFWARGYLVTTTGVDGEMIRRYVQYQDDCER